MRQQLAMLTVLFAMLFASAVTEADHEYLKVFPPAEDGMVRYVIQLPHKERGEEDDFRVEIFAGKVMLSDGVNLSYFEGEIETKPLEGWGFNYYEVAEFGSVVSTLVGVPPGTPMVEEFVSMPSMTIPYNSRIPLVVYVPDGGEVRYRIWKASETTEKAKTG
jgi:ecotin